MIKRPFVRVPENGNGDHPYSISNLCSEQLIKMLLKPQLVNYPGTLSSLQQESAAKGDPLQDVKNMQTTNQKHHGIFSESTALQNQSSVNQSGATILNSSSNATIPGNLSSIPKFENQTIVGNNNAKTKLEAEVSTDQLSQLTPTGQGSMEKLASGLVNPQNLVNQLTFLNQNQGSVPLQTNSWSMHPESLLYHSQQAEINQSDFPSTNVSLPSLDADECMFYSSCQPFVGTVRSPGPLSVFGMLDPSFVFPEANNYPLPSMGQDLWDNNLRILPQVEQLTSLPQQDPCNLNCVSYSTSLKDLSDESNNQSGTYSCHNVDVSNGGSSVIDPSVSSTILDEFSTLKNADFQNPSDCLVGNFSLSQDVQSQITSTSLGDSQALSRQDIPDNSGGTSSSNVDVDESSLLQNSSWQQVVPPVRTYTKVTTFPMKFQIQWNLL